MQRPMQPDVADSIARIFHLAQAGRGADAETAARALQRQYPLRGDANEALALVLVNRNKRDEAIPFAEAAVRAEPKNTGYLINLGRLYLKYELIEEAHPLIEKAFRLDPSMYQAPLAMGEFFQQTGSGQRAIRYLKQALAACPPPVKPEIELVIADCYSYLGQIDEAERLYKGTYGFEKLRPFALAHAANLRKGKVGSETFKALVQELRNSSLSRRDCALVHLAIGRIHESSGEYAEAYEHFTQSKAQQSRDFDLGKFTAAINSNIADFQPDVLRQFKGYGNESRLPVFVVGMPRSGTTLAEQIIAAHPRAGGVGELQRIGRMVQGLTEEKGAAHMLARMRDGGPERCRALADGYVSLLKFLAPGMKRVVDKMPHNFAAIGLIALLFPNARIVHCIRNPADNFISAYQNMMNSRHSYSYAPKDFALYYKEYLRLMRHWQSLVPERIFTLRYEDLVVNTEENVRRLLEFLGLPWDSRCLRFHEMGSMVKTFSRQQVRSAVHQGSVGRWRNYESELQPLFQILQGETGMQDGNS